MPLPPDIHPTKLVTLLSGVKYEDAFTELDYELWAQKFSHLFEIPPLEFTRMKDGLLGLGKQLKSLRGPEDLLSQIEPLLQSVIDVLDTAKPKLENYLTRDRVEDFGHWMARRAPVPMEVAVPLSLYALSRFEPTLVHKPTQRQRRAVEEVRSFCLSLRRHDPRAYSTAARRVMGERHASPDFPRLSLHQQRVLRTLRRLFLAERSVKASGLHNALPDALSAWANACETLFPLIGKFVCYAANVEDVTKPGNMPNADILHAAHRWCVANDLAFPFGADMNELRAAVEDDLYINNARDVTFYGKNNEILQIIRSKKMLERIYHDFHIALSFESAVNYAIIEFDNQRGRFDPIWQRAEALIPDLYDRVRDHGEPWLPLKGPQISSKSHLYTEARQPAKKALPLAPSPNRVAALSAFLRTSYSDAELRGLILSISADLTAYLPGPCVSLAQLADNTASLLYRRGLIKALFDRLELDRPNRITDLEQVRKLFRVPL